MPKNAPRASPHDWLELKQFWYEISFRIGMNICFRNCTATSAWSINLIFKKKNPNTVCPLSQHVLYRFVSQCFTLSLSRKATSSTGVFTRKPPPVGIFRDVPSPIRWSCDKTSQIMLLQDTLCIAPSGFLFITRLWRHTHHAWTLNLDIACRLCWMHLARS